MHYSRLRRRVWFVLFFCLGGLFAVAGCGQKVVEVSGKATVDGKPLTKGVIFFAPDKDNSLQTIPSGAVDDNGTYHLSTGGKAGAPLGWYKVYVGFEGVKRKGETNAAPLSINPKYLSAARSPLSIEVVDNPQPGAYDLKFTKK
jgi:hypothetical protein